MAQLLRTNVKRYTVSVSDSADTVGMFTIRSFFFMIHLLPQSINIGKRKFIHYRWANRHGRTFVA